MSDRLERIVGEIEADVLHLEQPLILLYERVLGLGEDVDEGRLVKILKGGDYRQATDKFGDEAELEQVLRLDFLQDLSGLALVRTADVGTEADRRTLAARGDDLLQP